MTALSRAFLAVYPPADVLDAIADRRRVVPVGGDVRKIPRDQWHLTLRFCGRVPDVDVLVSAVHASLSTVAPVDGFRLAGAGAFPKARRGSVLWIGCADSAATDAVRAVATAVERACVAGGLPPEDRGFRPHVTIARFARARDLRPVVAALGEAAVGGPWTVGEVRLVASETRSAGAVHTEVARIPLGG